MDEKNVIRRLLRSPLTAPVVWILNLATSALYFRRLPHATLAVAVFGPVILALLMMLVSAMRRQDQKALERVTEFAGLCFIVETSLLMLS